MIRIASRAHVAKNEFGIDFGTGRDIARLTVTSGLKPFKTFVMEADMGRDIILWLAGVPLTIIVLLHLFGLLH